MIIVVGAGPLPLHHRTTSPPLIAPRPPPHTHTCSLRYYALIMAAVYARAFKQGLVLLVTWPSNPEAPSIDLSILVMSSVERQYVGC